MKADDDSQPFIHSLGQKLDALEKHKRNIASPYYKMPVGETQPDGSIYLGYYNSKDWFVTATDAKDSKGKSLRLSFNAAASYAANLKVHGHDDWRMPPGQDDPNEPNILNKMFDERNTGSFKNTYNCSANYSHWYWSSTEDPHDRNYAYQLRFENQWGHFYNKQDDISVRPVRSISR